MPLSSVMSESWMVPRKLDPIPMPAPPGSKPKVVWLQNIAIAVEIIFPSLALVVCILRGYIRVLTKNIGADDYFIFAAMLLAIAQAVGAVMYIKLAYIGIHQWEVPPHDRTGAFVWSYINGIIYNPILALVKISVLTFLLRLAEIKRGVKMLTWCLLTFTAALTIAICCVVIFQCDKIAVNWDPTVTDANCISKIKFTLSTASLAILTDIAVVAIPFWIFLGVRMARRAKIALICVFALGIFVTAISIWRMVLIITITFGPKSPDPTFRINYVLSAVENNLAIVAASGPALWPLARRCFPRLFSSIGLSRGYQGNIPDIETADLKRETSTEASVQECLKRRFGGSLKSVFSSGNKKGGNSVRGAHVTVTRGIYTNHTIGGGSFGPGRERY